jgi:sulfur carrier protein ThiS
MKVTFRLFATLRDYLPPNTPNGQVYLDLPEGATIPMALELYAVPLQLAHIVMINNRHVLRPDVATRELKEGDQLAVFPAIGGG